jgi:hypothetical protein
MAETHCILYASRAADLPAETTLSFSQLPGMTPTQEATWYQVRVGAKSSSPIRGALCTSEDALTSDKLHTIFGDTVVDITPPALHP